MLPSHAQHMARLCKLALNQLLASPHTLQVFPRPEQGTALPKVTGTCPPFKSNPSGDTWLGCPDIKVTGADGKPTPASNLTWAWRITRADNQRIQTSLGPFPNFGKLPEANFIVEAAVGYNGPPTSTNTIYFLSSYLVVSPNNAPSQRPPGAAAPAGSAPAPGPKPPAGGKPPAAAAGPKPPGGGGGGSAPKPPAGPKPPGGGPAPAPKPAPKPPAG
jgi:hypothetical protein